MIRALERIATRPRLVLWLTLLVVAGLVALGGGGARLLNGGTDDPGSESAAASALMDREFPEQRPNVVLVVRPLGEAGVDDPAVTAAGLAVAEALAADPGVVGVDSYWADPDGDGAGSPLVTPPDIGAQGGLVLGRINGDETTADEIFARAVPPAVAAGGDVVSVEPGGPIAVRIEMQSTIGRDIAIAESVVFPLVLLILVLAFGSAVAALVPLGVGIIAIIGSMTVLTLLSRVTEVSIFSQNLVTALGLGLAIDYAMIVVRRFREELHGGASPRTAVVTTLRTAGRTVVYSAVTVGIALSVMLLFPLYFLRSFAYAGIAVVVFAVVSVLVVVPATLVLLGHRIDRWDLRPWLRRRLGRPDPGDGIDGSRWYALATAVMRRPRLVTVAATVVLLALALPFLGVRFGAPDERQLPEGSPSRTATEALATDFTDVPDWGIDVVVSGYTHDVAAADEAGGRNVVGEAVGDATLSPDPDVAALADYARRLSLVDGVVGVLTPLGPFQYGWQVAGTLDGSADLVSPNGSAYLQVMPESAIEQASVAAQDTVRAVRAVESPFPVLVGGTAAAQVDSQAAIGDRLWLALAIIVVATLVLVFLLTGSVVLPVQTVLVNALSLTVMFGAAVWVFQDGNLSGLLGFTPLGFLELSLPVLMFCLAFGLSMDYGVFVLSRMKEERDLGHDHAEAVARGTARTGGLVTAAAVILAVLLFAMGASRVTNIMMLGLGVGLAVLVDATVVRCLLVPAALAWTGPVAWWSPPALRRFHDRFGLRESERPAPEPADPAAEREPVGAR